MAKRNTSIRIDSYLDEELAARGSQTEVIHRDLSRLYELYAKCLREVKLSLPEASLIVDVLNGATFDVRSAPLLYVEAEDSIKLDGTAKKWEVDGQALVDKLKSLSLGHCLAIIDAAERFWEYNTTHADEEIIFADKVNEMFGIR